MANPNGPEHPPEPIFECKECKIVMSIDPDVRPLEGVEHTGESVTCPECGRAMKYREKK